MSAMEAASATIILTLPRLAASSEDRQPTLVSANVPLDQFRVLLLDMNSTFMFGEDRFGAAEDFGATYRSAGGCDLSSDEVSRAIRAAYAFLDARYADVKYEDDFPSVDEALAAVARRVPAAERRLLEETFARHELGVVPPAFSTALERLSATHELRLLTNIWAPKTVWLAELERAGVLSLFQRAVFSSDTRSVKPSLRLTQQALAGVSCGVDEILMIGDSIPRDLVTGRRAGLATAWITEATTIPPDAADVVDYCVPSLVALAGASASPEPSA